LRQQGFKNKTVTTFKAALCYGVEKHDNITAAKLTNLKEVSVYSVENSDMNIFR